MKNHSIFTRDSFLKLNKLLISKIYYQTILLDAVTILLAVLYFIKKNIIVGCILAGLAVAFPLFCFLLAHFKIKQVLDKGKDMYDHSYYDYVFNDQEFQVTYKYEEKESSTILNYSSIYKTIETKKYLYLFLTSRQAYLVDKEGFEQKEDIEKVKNLLKLNSKKYIYKNS